MSDDPLAVILAELRKIHVRLDKSDVRLDEIGVHLDKIDARLDKIDVRLDNAEREQARFRAEAAARHERILAALQEVRDDVTVAVHLAGRADAATGREAELGRNLISQLSRLRTRVEAIESRLPPATE